MKRAEVERAINYIVESFVDWYHSLKQYKQNEGPARGTISGALIVLEHLRSHCDLNVDAHMAPGGTQVAGANKSALKSILSRYDEYREFAREAGRTNRGLRGDMSSMLATLQGVGLDELDEDDRLNAINQMQQFLVERVKDYHNRKRISFIYDQNKIARLLIKDLLESAKESGKYGPVAQHLVGAKLQMRFPDETIRNDSYSVSDIQSDLPGDFVVGNTAFHVTVAPMPALFDKCQQNIRDGYRVYILVPEIRLPGARDMAEMFQPERIAVESIESFVAQNLDELSTFSGERMSGGFRRLLEIYNCRVDESETDKSLMIEMPKNLLNISLW